MCHLADKIRHQSSAHKYTGNLSVDAKRLGIKVDQLNETLKLKNGIASIARDIFKKIVPEHYMTVENWNKLPEEILMKEKILIGIFNFHLRSICDFVFFRFSRSIFWFLGSRAKKNSYKFGWLSSK